MDPFIESSGLWEDFHSHFIESIYRNLAPRLPRRYTASTVTRSYVVVVNEEGKTDHLAKPDVSVTESVRRGKPIRKRNESGDSADILAGSVVLDAFIADKFRENFVEIYVQGEERILITAIEVLSPSNKRTGTEGYKEYLRKRQGLLLGRANFIELDLVRGGTKMPMLSGWPDSPYTLLVCRSESAPRCRVWPADFRTRLPRIPVPLLDPDPDLILDLQPLVDEVYSLSRYADQIAYDRPLRPRLRKTEATWVRERLRNHVSE
jgi:hypothetical protein